MNAINKLKRERRKRGKKPEQSEFMKKQTASNNMIKRNVKSKGAQTADCCVPSGKFYGNAR